LKLLQKRVYNKLLRGFRAHEAVTGFAPGRSIVDSARPHANRAAVINLDLQDFFPSISAERVVRAWRGIGWNKESARILANICTCEKRLPQGAPTSPALSNLVCRKLDVRLTALMQLKRINGHYSRYADDLTFSFDTFGGRKRRRKTAVTPDNEARGTNRTVLRVIREIIEDEGFRIQKKKRVRVQRAHQRQTATGLVVNATVNLPREVRRKIRAMQHRKKLRKLTTVQQQELSGWEALQQMILTQRGLTR
jgi:retron-type reverse transcriptase